MRRFAAVFMFAGIAGSQIVETPVPGDPVSIDSGKVAGKVLSSGVKAYLGIPFAAPPVGDLRWREPQPVKAWKGVYNADRRMPECIQVLRPHNINHYFGEEPSSENCLYLNLWAPASAKAGSKLPVIVFIYGGGSTIGSSGMALYGGETVAARGAVFVNFNYRLGAFGFMAHPELTAESTHRQSGNYAYLDQIAALQWIQRNIAKFGGDPSKVIISGQSAGAGSVSLLQASPLAKGLFRGVVAMSGGAWGNNGQTQALADAEKTGIKIQETLKAKSLDDMRQVPADRILALQEEFQVGARGGSIRVGGANVDGYFLPQTPAQLFAAHKQNDVPAIVGFTHDESSNELRRAKTLADYVAAARKLYTSDADQFLKLYPASNDAEAQEMGRTAAREGLVERGARNWAMAQAKGGSAPVFIFMYSRVHPYIPGVEIADQDTATIGAYHTSDVPYWFGTQDTLNSIHPTRRWTDHDRDLSRKMTAALIAFANTGNPDTAAVPWPKWTAQNEQLVEFGDTIGVQRMNTPRLEFMAIHGGGASGPRAARD
ncbi:MAG: carboxylesterase family protein [Acidobacteriia bacterium]|nr:carboxylesterase family protein [Terriglobia bacterium]